MVTSEASTVSESEVNNSHSKRRNSSMNVLTMNAPRNVTFIDVPCNLEVAG